MRPWKLYPKILLSFIAVLLITAAAVFLLVHLAIHSLIDDTLDQAAGAVKRLRLSIENEVRLDPDGALDQKRIIYNLLSTLNYVFEVKFWIVGPDGGLLFKTFPGAFPDTSDYTITARRDDVTFLVKKWHSLDKDEFYARVPLNIGPDLPAELHVINTEELHPHHHFFLLLGLGEVFLIIALLMFPITRQITRPIKRLQHSALRIADGDFGHRADAGGRDEIGDLARAFNHMTDRVEQMIRSAKELMANVSHELRSPLTRIRIAGELGREKLKKGDAKGLERHLEAIALEIDHMDLLVGRILFLSKLDLKESPLACWEFDLAELISLLVKEQELVIFRRNLSFNLDLPPTVEFFGDPEALRTALANVIDNALKYTPDQGRIEMILSRDHGYYTIKITNTCPGVPATDPKMIFKPFHRAGDLKIPGAGLGLAIVRGVIEKHQGRIMAESKSGLFSLEIKLPVTGS